jgi:hypothetical protein
MKPLIRTAVIRYESNLVLARQRKATAETAAFIDEQMPRVRSFSTRWNLMRFSLQSADSRLKGLYCEFGVESGESINFIASLVKQPVHGFDSFEGLPDAWRDGYPKGTFAVEKLPPVRSNVVLHKGWFRDSIPPFRAQRPEPLSFVHMDADLYSSTQDVFTLLSDRFVPGTVIQFDDFFNYPGWREGESKAFREFVESRGVRFEHLGYVSTGCQVAVRITSVGPPSR